MIPRYCGPRVGKFYWSLKTTVQKKKVMELGYGKGRIDLFVISYPTRRTPSNSIRHELEFLAGQYNQ